MISLGSCQLAHANRAVSVLVWPDWKLLRLVIGWPADPVVKGYWAPTKWLRQFMAVATSLATVLVVCLQSHMPCSAPAHASPYDPDGQATLLGPCCNAYDQCFGTSTSCCMNVPACSTWWRLDSCFLAKSLCWSCRHCMDRDAPYTEPSLLLST